MITKFLLTDETGNKVGDTVAFSLVGERGLSGVAQVVMGGGAATAKLFGRINSTFAWKSIQTWMADDAVEVVLFPEMKGEVSGYTSGTISLALVGGLLIFIKWVRHGASPFACSDPSSRLR